MKPTLFLTVFAVAISFFVTSHALEGPNVCTRQEAYNVTVEIVEQHPTTEKVEATCPENEKCTKDKTVFKEVIQNKTITKYRPIEVCCEGYVEDQGRCVAEQQCETGFSGPNCDIRAGNGESEKDTRAKCATESHSCRKKKCCDSLKCDQKRRRCVKDEFVEEDFEKCVSENHSCRKKKCCEPFKCDKKTRRCVKDDDVAETLDKCVAEDHSCRKNKCCDPFKCNKKTHRCVKDESIDETLDKCASENHSCRKKKCCEPYKCDKKTRRCVKDDDVAETVDKCAAEDRSCRKKKCCDPFKCDKKTHRCVKDEDTAETVEKCATENHSCRKKKCCESFNCDKKTRRCLKNDEQLTSVLEKDSLRKCVHRLQPCAGTWECCQPFTCSHFENICY